VLKVVKLQRFVLILHVQSILCVGNYLGTQEIRFGRKMDEIAKFSIFDEKNEIHNFGRNLDEKWPTGRRDRRKKVVKFFHIHWHYHNAFTVGSKERMPRIIGMRMD